MKNFESTFNRWLDGSLDETERRKFESTLDDETLRAARSWPGVKSLLKDSAKQIALPYPDFLNEQIHREIQQHEKTGFSLPLFPLRRLILAGALCVGMAAALAAFFFPPEHGTDSSTLVVSAEPATSGTSVSTFQAPSELGAVIWLEGMPFIPDGEQVQ